MLTGPLWQGANLPLAVRVAEWAGKDISAWPQGAVRLRAVIHYQTLPGQDWSFVPVLVSADGVAWPLTEAGRLWRGSEGVALSPLMAWL